jgi:hypothetical protein
MADDDVVRAVGVDKADLSDMATYTFLQYMTEYCAWEDPTEGTVSPILGDFFRWCDPAQPALVRWARWLLLPHEADDGPDIISPPLAQALAEVMIEKESVSEDLARAMRRAVRDSSYGQRDPDQLGLF